MKKQVFFLLITSLFCVSAFSQAIKIGQRAPTVKTGEVIKGVPLTEFKNGKIYVVEFWATWCAPCKEAMPHISALAKEYDNEVVFTGVSVSEGNTSLVRPFVEKMGDNMAYNVVIDAQDSATAKKGYMTENWMRPLGIKGIPATVIVGKTGLIEWVGHPMEMEPVLKRLITGNWNSNFFVKQQQANKYVDEMSAKLGKNPDWAALTKHLENTYPSISADSSIKVVKISHAGGRPVSLILDFLKGYGSKISIGELNRYAWEIFKASTDRVTLNFVKNLISDRLKEEVTINEDVAYILDTYAGFLYKLGEKDAALSNQIKAYSNVRGDTKVLDITTGKIVIGLIKANFLITAFKMERGVATWINDTTVDSIYHDIAKDHTYWKSLRGRLKHYYSPKKADSLISFTKMLYYKQNKQWDNYAKNLLEYSCKHLSDQTSAMKNEVAWGVFLNSHNRDTLKETLNWLSPTLREENANVHYCIDTYANLLYKLGKTKEAISWEVKAINLAPADMKDSYVATLEAMKQGKPTWKIVK